MNILKRTSKELIEKQDEFAAELAVDIYETENEFVVESPIAGVKKQDLDVFVDKGMLVINGQRASQNSHEGKNYLYSECYWGKFSRRVMLPQDVNENQIDASLKDGLLTITFPKTNKKSNQEEKVEVAEIKD
jgi:HSP20 family protein